jgi:hypothetical protein
MPHRDKTGDTAESLGTPPRVPAENEVLPARPGKAPIDHAALTPRTYAALPKDHRRAC